MRTGQSSLQGIRTLRFRLMIWNATVVIVTAIVTLMGLREAVRFTLIRELDQLLSEDVREIELSLVNFERAESTELQEQLDRKDAGHAQHKWFVQLINIQQERVVYQSQHAPHELPLSARAALTPQSYLQWRFFERNVNNVRIRIGSSLELIRADVGRIDRLVAMTTGIVLLIAPLCGYWLAGRATRPLNQMIATMAGLRPSRLDERLIIRGTGDELDRLSETFNRLLDRIGSYLQDHRDFLANAAHELRTPLAAIRNSIEVTLAKQRSTEEYEVLLADIEEEAAALSLLVNQLLLLSETESERLRVHTERVRLDELVVKAVDMFGGVAECKDITLSTIDIAASEIFGNAHHLRQVIYNLLDNALKFTAAGGTVAIELKQDGQFALLKVSDSGIGIPEQDLQQIFERFFQVDRRRFPPLDGQANTYDKLDVPRGSGLGLSICRAIVRAHEGNIRAESQLHHGTCIIVRLPLAAPLREPSKLPSPAEMPNATLQG